jgi:V/A-type H+-transporting ATPase subunit I
MKQFLEISMICAITTIILGLITGSIFGDLITTMINFHIPFDLFKRAKIALGLSIGIGWLHVFFGFLINARREYKARNIRGAVDNINWAILEFIIGLLFFMLLGYFTLPNLILYFILAILVMNVILTIYLGGLFKLMDISGVFGNMLSYARLFALAMATAAIALAINVIAQTIDKFGLFGLSIILVPIVLAGGHLFSFGINSMGAYIHPLRLHYVEFFSKFYQGNGIEFTPFKQKRKYTYVENKRKK